LMFIFTHASSPVQFMGHPLFGHPYPEEPSWGIRNMTWMTEY
jgi:hypothetical protein